MNLRYDVLIRFPGGNRFTKFSYTCFCRESLWTSLNLHLKKYFPEEWYEIDSVFALYPLLNDADYVISVSLIFYSPNIVLHLLREVCDLFRCRLNIQEVVNPWTQINDYTVTISGKREVLHALWWIVVVLRMGEYYDLMRNTNNVGEMIKESLNHRFADVMWFSKEDAFDALYVWEYMDITEYDPVAMLCVNKGPVEFDRVVDTKRVFNQLPHITGYTQRALFLFEGME